MSSDDEAGPFQWTRAQPPFSSQMSDALHYTRMVTDVCAGLIKTSAELTKCDVLVAIAGHALAIAVLASAAGVPRDEMDEATKIAWEQTAKLRDQTTWLQKLVS